MSSRFMPFLSNAIPSEMKDVWSSLSKYLILKERSAELVLCLIKNELQFSEALLSLDWCSRQPKLNTLFVLAKITLK